MEKGMRKRATTGITLTLLLVSILMWTFNIQPVKASGLPTDVQIAYAWWGSNWSRRRPITITERSGSNLIDYELKLVVAYDGDMQADFDDLRFTHYDGATETEVPYWVEKYYLSENATVWVKVPLLSANENATFYMYYGNPSAGSASNGSATFDFFDDFNDGVWTNKWETFGNVTITESGGILNIAKGGDYGTGLWSLSIISGKPLILEDRKRRAAEGDFPWSDVYTYFNSTTTGDWIRNYDSEYWGKDPGHYIASGGPNFGSSENQNGSSVGTNWREYRVTIDDKLVTAKRGVSLDSLGEKVSITLPTSFNNYNYKILLIRWPNPQVQWDWIRVRDYAYPEPMYSFGSEELNHNVAITSITPHKTIVGQGLTLKINVTIANQGNYTENFNVTLYANITSVALQNVTLSIGNSTTVIFTWNTTSFAKGNYTLSAYATPVLGEIDIADNSYIDGIVRVNMVGDLRPAWGLVDIVDVVYAAIHYGTQKRDPNYDPNADVNCDGIIDIVDVVIVALHYGETDP